MKLAIATSSFPRFPGDHASVFVHKFARGLVQQGVDVHVLAPHERGYPTREQWDGIAIHRFRYVPPVLTPTLCYGSGIPDNLRKDRTTWLQIPFYSGALPLALWRLVRREKIDVVNSHWLLMQGMQVAFLRSLGGVPHIGTVHAAELSILPRLPLARQLTSFTLRYTDRLVCVSERGRKLLEEIRGAPVEATVMPMGVDLAQFRNSSLSRAEARRLVGARAERTLLFVGRLAEKKGVNHLIRALATLRTHCPDLELLVVGTGHLEEELKRECARLELEEAVRFVGLVANDELPAYYRAADVVVIPSVISESGNEEGMPVVLLEALAAGCRVVATETGGIPEMVRDGRNGFLVKPADVDDLAEGIRRALASREDHEIEKAARESVQFLNWPEVAGAYCRIMEQLMADRSQRNR